MPTCIIIMLVIIEYVIRQKKKVYRTYIDSSTKKAGTSYSRYDGYWFVEDIGLDDLMEKNPEDEWLQKTGKEIKRCQILFFCTFAFMMTVGILGKVYGWI